MTAGHRIRTKAARIRNRVRARKTPDRDIIELTELIRELASEVDRLNRIKVTKEYHPDPYV